MLFFKNKKEKFNDIKNKINNEIILLNQYDCCFTGHRPQKLPWGFNENDIRYNKTRDKVKLAIIEAINNGYKTFISGMALGFDIMCAELVIELKKQYSDIKIVGAIPCSNQDERWKPADKLRYQKVLSKLDKKIVLKEEYTQTCLQERNEFMINNSSLVIALYNGKGGGTANTLRYAKENGCKVIIIRPEE